MIAVVSRVSEAHVEVGGRTVGEIENGLLVYLGIGAQDTPHEAEWVADRVCGLRVMPDGDGRMNVSPRDSGAALLIIPNFTLYGDCASSRRPAFTGAAPPEAARLLYERFVLLCSERGLPVQTGRFGAHMAVHSVADGPVNLIIRKESEGDRP